MEGNKEGTDKKDESLESNENSQDSEISSKKSENSDKVEEEQQQQQTANPDLNDEDIDEDLQKKIKGDAIGDTLYSERFILKTLMELKDMDYQKLDKEMESKLEILWDTTIEKAVVEVLLQYGFLEIAGIILDSASDERLIEIMLGIIANMGCMSETREQLCDNEDVMASILNQLSSSDPLILHQLMRLFHSAILFENKCDEKIWFSHFQKCENFVEKFSYIFANSTSNTLLTSSFEALNGICAKFAAIECQSDSEKDSSFPQLFVKKCLVDSMIEAFNTVIPQLNESECGSSSSTTTDVIPTQSQIKFMNLFLELNMVISQYESLSMEAYKTSLTDFQRCLSRILFPLCHKMYLLPLSSIHQGVIENINDITQALSDPFDKQIFSQMIQIWDLIEEDKGKDRSNSDWDDEEDSTFIDSDDFMESISMTILEFLTRTGFNAEQENFTASLKKLNLDLVMKLFERINDNDDPEDEIKSVIQKMKRDFLFLFEKFLQKEFCQVFIMVNHRIPSVFSKTYVTPRRPYEKPRLDAELRVIGQFGLRNKREVWRVKYTLAKIRKAARELLTLEEKDEKRLFQGNALLRRLVRIGVLDESRMKLDYVLGLKIEDFLERRLQTQVFKLGLAKSYHHARVLIRQRHIRVRKQVVNIPSFVSPFGGGRPGRVKRKNMKKGQGGSGGADEEEED
ncbi:hypothetical protein PVAND_007117 [Polypedilum vanderplanki]|uniref:Small ribosomal subunit protein uS4 n=1 Tax=Polypedilum vanderplanki TaxID=319348 RepID=A0A9J6C5F1_POLVA|nr:hypothetical protein PVAND_007117 [Polypedilum vanderplanki]